MGLGGARLALRRHAVASRREVGAEDELALATVRLETAVCLGDLIEGDPLGDAQPQRNAPSLSSRTRDAIQHACGHRRAVKKAVKKVIVPPA